jgi:predicted nucleic acid-binding protein
VSNGKETNGIIDVRKPPLVYLDTNVFIRGIEGDETVAAPVQRLLNRLRDFPDASITSELTLAELLAPAGRADTVPLDVKEPLYLDLIVSGNFIVLHPVARDILVLTAHIRSRLPQKLPDAIHIATASQAGCKYFMSHDRDGKRLPPALDHILPDDKGVDTVIDALRA